MKRKITGILIILAVGSFLMVSLVAVSSFAATASGKKVAATHKTAAKKTMKVMPSDEVKAVQEALNKEGFKLKVDGIAGKHTHAALKGYQKKNGLKITGKTDQATLAKLGIK